MIKYKIFLASSVNEFADERMALKDFTRRMADVLIDHGIRLSLFICEYAENAVAYGRMQSEYNREIEDSDLFLLLAGQRLGQYTVEEYEYALACRRKSIAEKPLLMTAFQKCETDGGVYAFAASLDENVRQVEFTSIRELKASLSETLSETLPIQAGRDEVRIKESIIKI
jgi:hypothetical protein